MREIEKPMYYGASQITFEKARRLRSQETTAELILWEHLKGKQFHGLKFRRQHPIETFIVDFYCHQAKLVIELDGKIHLKNKDADKLRSDEIEKYGIKVLRFTNEEIITDSVKVLSEIEQILNIRQVDRL